MQALLSPIRAEVHCKVLPCCRPQVSRPGILSLTPRLQAVVKTVDPKTVSTVYALNEKAVETANYNLGALTRRAEAAVLMRWRQKRCAILFNALTF